LFRTKNGRSWRSPPFFARDGKILLNGSGVPDGPRTGAIKVRLSGQIRF